MTALPLLDRWLADLRADRAARTIQRYGGAVRHFLDRANGATGAP
jgi:hypothetical protein